MEPINLKNKKKMRIALFISFFIFIALSGRIAYIQFINGEHLQTLAYDQQVQKRKINPKRGLIYDASEKYILAISSTVYTVTVNPTNIEEGKKEMLASKLTEMFNLDYEQVL